MATMYLDVCEITCPDVAEMSGAPVGAPEWRLLDHPESPGYSADFPSREAAMRWAAWEEIEVVDLTEGRAA